MQKVFESVKPSQMASTKSKTVPVEERLAEALELKEHKRIDVESYSASELLYLATVILQEVNTRNENSGQTMKYVNKAVTDLTHDIELNFKGTNTDKVKMFDELQQVLRDRRHAKQEVNIISRMAFAVHAKQSTTQSLSYIAELLDESSKREETGWGMINECIPTYRQGEFKRLLTKISI